MATRTIANGGGNFNSTGTWVEGAVPVAGDAVVATVTSGNLTVNVASGGVGLASFIMIGYTGVLTMTSTLTISGSLTLVAGMGTIAGTGAFICNTTATLTSGGKVIPALTLGGTSQTFTLGDNFQVGVVTTAAVTTGCTINSNTLSISGNVTISRAVTGTTNIVYNAPVSTTQVVNITAAVSLANQTINAAGTVSITSYVITGGTLTYTAGTISGVALLLITGACTLNTSGMTWGAVTYSGGSQTYTLTSNLIATGLVTLSGTTLPIYTGYQITTSGGLSVTGSGTHAGTTKIVVTNGAVSCSSTTRVLRLDLTLDNTNAGTITIGTVLYYNTGTLKYIAGSGNIVVTGSTLYIILTGTTTVDTNVMTWETVLLQSGTVSLSSMLRATTFNFASTSVAFAGAYGFTVGTLSMLTTGNVVSLAPTIEYFVTTALTSTSATAVAHNGINTTSAGNTAKLTLMPGSTQDNSFVNFTDIDASNGQTICTYKGTITTCINVRTLPTDLQSRGSIG